MVGYLNLGTHRFPIAGRTGPQGARRAPTKWTRTSAFPRFVGLTPAVSVEYPSPELGDQVAEDISSQPRKAGGQFGPSRW